MPYELYPEKAYAIPEALKRKLAKNPNNRLTEQERNWLNNYHKLVYNIVSKYLTINEKEYLRRITKEI